MDIDKTVTDVDMIVAPAAQQSGSRTEQTNIKEAPTGFVGPSRSAPARRQLRARPSDPVPVASPYRKPRKSDAGVALRQPTDRELEYINSKLAPEHLDSRRDTVVKEKEGELKEVVDKHDTDVRERFHLERYTSILEGWNPKVSSLRRLNAWRTELTSTGRQDR